jgi:hypothetical protein
MRVTATPQRRGWRAVHSVRARHLGAR